MPIFQKAKQALEAGNDRLRTLAANTSTVVWHTSADGSVTMPNPSWEAFTGQTPAQYRGWGWLQAIHPEDRVAATAIWHKAVQARQVTELAYRLRRHDGAYRHMQSQGAPVFQGEAVREWVGVSVDVTASREAEIALRRSEERFRFLDRLGQAARNQTDATEVMATTARLLGEYLGATRCAYADVDPDGDRFTIRSDWSAPGVPSSAGVYSLELFGPQATGNLRQGRHLVVRDVDRELGDEGGGRMFNAIGIKAIICAGLVKGDRLVAMMAVHQATPRDWTEQDLAMVAEVVDRCWAHIERVRDNAMLREQDRRKDEFLATLAHELRNPLAPVKYATAMLRNSDDPAQVAQARDVIDRQVSQMARLIDDLLDLSRINRGLIQLQRERVSVPALLQQALEVVRPAIEAAHHRLELQLPPEDLVIDADPTRIVQVVGNLLANAAKYTPDGGRIRLAARRAGNALEVEVADDGIGIPPQQQAEVFRMFTQLHQGSARARGGLGIGLSLAKTLVEMHGGRLAVASPGPGQGSTFTLTLPLAAGSAPPAVAPQPAAEGMAPAAAQTARVLVVEDNADGREMLVSLLDLLGWQVAAAADGPAALELAASFAPQIVLLDLGLPGMDGVEVCRRLRAQAGLQDAFILALTGWGAERDRQRTADAGFDAHLTKPLEPRQLQAMLVRCAAAWPRGPAGASTLETS